MRWRPLVRSRSGLVGIAVVVGYLGMAALAPALAPGDPLTQNLRAALRPPGETGYILGADELGRDVLSRIIYASRISLAVAGAAVAFGVLLGIPLGLVSGFYGRRIDSLVMRVSDILMAVPRILLAIATVAIYGTGFWSLVVAIGFPDVPEFARIARASTMAIRRMDYVSAAQALGNSDWRIMLRHILPNLMGPLTVQATFSMAASILTAGALSFLGLGIQPPTPEWGAMLAQARSYMRVASHMTTYPGIALAVLVLGINLLGDALRQAFDPRFRGRDY
ncbi:MAG: ABC transporter permease [Armatimonadetes bacterium]|nr:ABC transporter permease [Armatimonadota bacterium]